jgi:prephenate dehydrogenase
MHILFRPSQTPDLLDRKVVLIEGDFDDTFAKLIGDITQSQIVWFDSIEYHDKQMAIQQALVHRVLLLLDEQLANSYGTTYISKKVIDLTNRIKKGNLHLYKAIQNNEHLNEHLETFKKKLTDFNIENYMKP